MNIRHEHIVPSFEKLATLPHLQRSQSKRNPFLSPTEARLKLIESGFTFPKAAEKISFLMCKGGVGKTTSSYFLAVRLASFGARVLVIDTDPQANLTEAFHPEYYGFRLSENTPVLVDVLTGVRSIQSAILPLTSHLHILPSTSINSLLETKLSHQQPFFPSMLKDVLRSVERDYEYVIIDCGLCFTSSDFTRSTGRFFKFRVKAYAF